MVCFCGWLAAVGALGFVGEEFCAVGFVGGVGVFFTHAHALASLGCASAARSRLAICRVWCCFMSGSSLLGLFVHNLSDVC